MELMEQLKILKELFSYGLLGEVVIAIGLLINFFYQRHKIESLETQIKSQKGILESADSFFKLFDLKKLKDYGEILAEKAKAEKEIEFEKIRKTLNEKVQKQEIEGKLVKGELFALVNAFIDALLKLPSEVRGGVISRMADGITKKQVEEANKQVQQVERELRIKALSGVFSQSKQAKGVLPVRNEKEGETE